MNHEKRSNKRLEYVLGVVSIILVGITLYALWLGYSVWKDKPHEIAELQRVDLETPVIGGVTSGGVWRDRVREPRRHSRGCGGNDCGI